MTLEALPLPLILAAATVTAVLILRLCRRSPRRWTRDLRLSGARATIYVFQDRADPSLVKVGLTTRLSHRRQAEVARTMAAGAPLRQLLALDLAHGQAVETVAHRRLRRRYRQRSGRGREWYRATGPGGLDRLLAEVEAAAAEVRVRALRRGCWSPHDEARARRWRLTAAGPVKESLFQPKDQPAPRARGRLGSAAGALLAALMLAGASSGHAREPGTEPAVDCPDAGLLGPALLSRICWDCIFPLRLGGAVVAPGDGEVPRRAADQPLCLCSDRLGVPRIGITLGLWEPARLIELVRAPGCSPLLGGARIEATGRLQRGSRGGTLYDSGDKAFYHYHLWTFPLLAMLELFTPAACRRDTGIDMDLLYLSELDPTWNHDELAFFANPESAAVATLDARAACMADAVAATAGEPIDALFWCAGAWGHLYPLAGAHLTHTSIPRNTSLLAARALAALHRRGLARRTMGADALCEARIEPFLPKSQYQFSQAYPRPEANDRHALGASTLAWGEHRVLPGIGEDVLHLAWRWLDCCVTY